MSTIEHGQAREPQVRWQLALLLTAGSLVAIVALGLVVRLVLVSVTQSVPSSDGRFVVEKVKTTGFLNDFSSLRIRAAESGLTATIAPTGRYAIYRVEWTGSRELKVTGRDRYPHEPNEMRRELWGIEIRATID